ncbi:hypothetical protein D9611_005484 [Ephemerocybe angulata]|uniref:Uncharacterized protein n=1 Tax=Ephemerocybe angulata TaxID=980116 RepID=A0A8H5C0E5_9AGAR|nr:hypothetical protein D9611_005484 [Tulosesus angulatus]
MANKPSPAVLWGGSTHRRDADCRVLRPNSAIYNRRCAAIVMWSNPMAARLVGFATRGRTGSPRWLQVVALKAAV